MNMHIQGNSSSRAGAPLSSPRPNSVAINKGQGSTIHILGHQAPPRLPIDKIFNPGLNNKDNYFSLADIADVIAGEQLMSYIIMQLKRGPTSLREDTVLNKVNAMLPPTYDRISRKTWKSLLQLALILAVQNIKVFDDRGLRNMEDIYADSALLLEIDTELFAGWENHFGLHCIVENLTDPDETSSSMTVQLSDEIMSAIKLQLTDRASGAFETGDYRDALLYSFETRIQWAVARHSAIRDNDTKVSKTKEFIIDLAEKNKVAVGRALALIVRHSKLSKEKIRRTHPLIPHWHRKEMGMLIEAIMENIPNVVNDTSFRGQLTAVEYKALNDVIIKANYSDIMLRLSKMNPDRPIDDFIDAIYKADESGGVLLDIVLQMIDHHERDKLN